MPSLYYEFIRKMLYKKDPTSPFRIVGSLFALFSCNFPIAHLFCTQWYTPGVNWSTFWCKPAFSTRKLIHLSACRDVIIEHDKHSEHSECPHRHLWRYGCASSEILEGPGWPSLLSLYMVPEERSQTHTCRIISSLLSVPL